LLLADFSNVFRHYPPSGTKGQACAAVLAAVLPMPRKPYLYSLLLANPMQSNTLLLKEIPKNFSP
jgi:hypothetical protein